MSYWSGWLSHSREILSAGWDRVVNTTVGVVTFVTSIPSRIMRSVKGPVVTTPPTGTITGGGVVAGPVQTSVVSVQPVLPPVHRIAPQPLAEELLRGVEIHPIIISTSEPIFGEQFQYKVCVEVQPAWDVSRQGVPPPVYEKWITVTYTEPQPHDQIMRDAISVVAGERVEGSGLVGNTIAGVNEIQPVFYQAPTN